MVDVKCLSDCELQNQLEKLGFSPGPILPSTREAYEKKLVQLLVSPSCEPPVVNGHRNPNGSQDSNDNEELNIILKGNIILSTEKGKESKKNPVFDIQRQQEDMVKPNSDYNNLKMLIKRHEASTSKARALDICCLGRKGTKRIRCAATLPRLRIKHGCVTKEKDNCAVNQSIGSEFPGNLKLAILGIFIIVMFVYITVEKKPLFG